jgi:OmpA family protein
VRACSVLRFVAIILAAVLFAGPASAQLIRRQANEKEAAQYIYGAFLTQAAAAIIAERTVVAPELQRRLKLSPGARRDQVYEALVALTDNKGFSVRKSTPEELAAYVSGRFATGLNLPVYTLQVDDLKLLVQYDLVAHIIPFVGELYAPGSEPRKPVAERKPSPNLVWTELFEFNKATLRRDAGAKLDRELLPRVKGGARIRVSGHSDRLGKEAYNRKLAEQRAAAVRGYLVSKGVDAGSIEIVGVGASEPVKACAEEKKDALIDCLAPNRRVEVEIQASR